MATATKTGGTDEKWVPGRFETVDTPVVVTLTLTADEAGALRTLTGYMNRPDNGTSPKAHAAALRVWEALYGAGVSRVGAVTVRPKWQSE